MINLTAENKRNKIRFHYKIKTKGQITIGYEIQNVQNTNILISKSAFFFIINSLYFLIHQYKRNQRNGDSLSAIIIPSKKAVTERVITNNIEIRCTVGFQTGKILN